MAVACIDKRPPMLYNDIGTEVLPLRIGNP